MKLLFASTILLVGMTSQPLARAAIFTFDTSATAGWTATAGGAVNATPFAVTGFGNAGGQTVLSISSTGDGSGTFLAGGSIANFDGFWTARYSFSLPPGAVNVQLNYYNLFGDDRVVMKLNGTTISSALAIPPGGSLNGSMVLTDGGALQPYTFAGAFGSVSGTANSGFVPGLNTLDFIVNNTGGDPNGPLKPTLVNDGTAIGLTGVVSFDVPEPSSASLLLLALGGALLRNRKASATK
jgi:hypothetical protein